MRRILLVLSIAIFFALPAFAAAQVGDPLVPCGGEGQPACQACHVAQVGQNIINFLVGIAAFIAVALFAWAGFLMVTAAGNEGQISKAKETFGNVMVGIIIVLVGWLVIDTVMKWAFQGNQGERGSPLYESTKAAFGPWNQINCVKQPEFIAGATATTTPGGVAVGGGGTGSCTAIADGPCSVSSLQSSFGSSAGAASQICNVESRGISSSRSKSDVLRNSGGRAFSVGLFQVNLTVHKLSCNGQNLDCPSAFTGRNFNATIVNENLYNRCVALAADPSCNVQKAKELYTNRGNWRDWANSADKCSL